MSGPEALGVCCSEPCDPTTDRLVSHVEPSLGQKIFDISQAEVEPEIQPDSMLDDGRRELEAGELAVSLP